MAKVKCFICNRKIHPKDALKRDNRTFERQVLLCSRECYEEDETLDEICEDMSTDEARMYRAAVNMHFPGTQVHTATCLQCREYDSGSCEGFLAEPLECMVEKAEELKAALGPSKSEEFRRW